VEDFGTCKENAAAQCRLAATVFVRSKPVNWVRILPQMFMFLTDNENWCFTYIDSYTLIGSYMSAFMYAPGHHWPNLSKTQPLDPDHGVRGPGRCSNLEKNMLTRFFERPPPGNFCLKTSPLSRNSGLAKRMRPGREGVLWTCVEKISHANHIDCISLFTVT